MNPKVKTYVFTGFTDAPAAGNRLVRIGLPPQYGSYFLRSITFDSYWNDEVTGLVLPKATTNIVVEELKLVLLDSVGSPVQVTPPIINDVTFPWDIILNGTSIVLNNNGKLTFEDLLINDSFIIQYRLWNKGANIIDSAVNLVIEIEPLSPEQ